MTPPASPLVVKCWVWGAQIGYPCRTRRGYVREPHPARAKAVRNLIRVTKPDGTRTLQRFPNQTRRKKGKRPSAAVETTVLRDLARRDERARSQRTQADLKAQFLARQSARENFTDADE